MVHFDDRWRFAAFRANHLSGLHFTHQSVNYKNTCYLGIKKVVLTSNLEQRYVLHKKSNRFPPFWTGYMTGVNTNVDPETIASIIRSFHISKFWQISTFCLKICIFGFYLLEATFKVKAEYTDVQFVISNPWKVPWNWIAFSKNYFVISPGLLYHLVCYITWFDATLDDLKTRTLRQIHMGTYGLIYRPACKKRTRQVFNLKFCRSSIIIKMHTQTREPTHAHGHTHSPKL